MSHKASNQTSFNETNENRLAIRRKLRRILDELHRKKSTLLDIKSGQRDFESILSLVRDIFHQDYMENVRELNLDAIITKELTMILKLQAQKLSDVSKPYELDTLFTSIRTTTKSNQSQLKWENLGLLVNELWTHSYSLTTLQGPIKQQQKVRAMKRPREKDTDFAAVAKADVLENKIGDDKIDEATNKRVQRLLEYLHDLENSNQSVQNGQNIDLLKLLVDPIDPLQTIENFFDFSFLIKEKQVGELLDKQSFLPTVIVADAMQIPDNKRQMVLSMSMSDLEQLPNLMFDIYKINHPLHRDDALYQQQSVQQQIDIGASNVKTPPNIGSTTKKKNIEESK